MLRPGDEWIWGEMATAEKLDQVRYDLAPPGIPLRRLLEETHQALYRAEKV